jgi:hypothetical protein
MNDFDVRFADFCTEVCEKNRFFYSDKTRIFLKELYEFISGNAQDSRVSCIKTIELGQVFYRARSHAFLNVKNKFEEKPFDSKGMKPVTNIRANGRLNAYNVNALYLAYNKSTAISEVRAPVDAPISVAKFITNKELRIVRFDSNSDVDSWFSFFSPALSYHLAHRFSQPLDHPEHQSREYIPTQIISEYLRSKGIDGIEYPSQFTAYIQEELKSKTPVSMNELLKQKTEFNLCLFDIDAAYCDSDSIEVLTLKNRINIIDKYEPQKFHNT